MNETKTSKEIRKERIEIIILIIVNITLAILILLVLFLTEDLTLKRLGVE